MISLNRARWLDRKIGRPLCFFISILRSSRKREIPVPEDIRNILVIKMWGIGTIVLASPVFRNIKMNCPHAKLYFLTLTQNRELYKDSIYIDEVVCFDITSFSRAVVSFIKILFMIRRQKFEIIFDFEIVSRFTALITCLSTRSYTVGYAPAGIGKDIFDKTIPYDESMHMTNIFLSALDAIKFTIFRRQLLELPVSNSNKYKVDNFLKNNYIHKFIVINPNTSELAIERLWPLNYFIDLSILFFKYFDDIDIVVIGGENDIERVDLVMNKISGYGRVFSVAGQFSIKETTYLLKNALLLVSNDSGPLHLGVTAGIHTIGLFGPESPILYGHQGEKHVSLSAGETCSPCISVYRDKVVNCTKDAICMKKITVDKVFDVIMDILGQNKSLISKEYVTENLYN